MGRDSGKGKKNRRDGRSFGDDDVQKPGKLMLNNPLIPAELDEDIDDDLAFDSEDEALYGQFFSQTEKKPSATASKTKKGRKGTSSKQRGNDEDDDDFPEPQFSAIGKAEKSRYKRGRGDGDDDEALYNYHEEGQSSNDENDDEYIDLSDMFDLTMKEKERQKSTDAARKRKSKSKANVSEEAADSFDVHALEELGTARVAKKRRGAKVTEEAESLYGMAGAGVDGTAGSYGSALRTFVKAKDVNSQEEDAVRQRLRDAMTSKHNLLSMDADDPTKERVLRREVRRVVEQNLEKYKPLLRELNTAKHVQFPMKAPDSTPTPSSIGGIVAAAKARFADGSGMDGAGTMTAPAGKLASRMHDLLSRAGLASRQAQGTGDGTAGSGGQTESIGDYVQFDEDDHEGHGSFDAARASGLEGEEAPSRGYMAKLKAMLAYENSRRQRFNRIKSKTYRRILRKEKDRERERREKAFELLHPELARKRLTEKLMKARAEERITQKHKNTSAWVKHAKRFADFDANAKDAINEQHALHQRLMQKMEQDAGEENYERYLAEGGDADSAMSSEEDRVVDELFAASAADVEGRGAKKTTKSATSLLWKSVADGDDSDGEGASGGDRSSAVKKARAELGQMKFMKAAREREQKEYEEQMQTLQDDIRRYQSGEALDAVTDSDADEQTAQDGEAKRRQGPTKALGRMTFAGDGRARRALPSTSVPAGSKGEVMEAIQMKRQGGIRAEGESADKEQGFSSDDDGSSFSDEVRGASDDDGEKQHGESIAAGGEGESGDAHRNTRREATTRKAKKEAKTAASKQAFAGLRKNENGTAPVTKSRKAISTRVVVTPGSSLSTGATGVSSVTSAPISVDARGDEGKAEDDLRMHQEYLISRAFAHDDVDEEFLKDKEAQVETVMRPEDRNGNLPGWGEWGGEDAQLNKRHQEKLAHATLQKRIEQSFLMKSRADAALDHVIINHDGVELVPDRMTLHMVPRPFSNPQEFARSMRQPLGPEWSSALGFKEGVQPRVEVQQGHSVLPLDISLRGKKRSATKRRKTDLRGK